MLNDWEKLRQEQLKFIEHWNKSFIQFHREKNGHNHFSLNYGEIYALRVDDLVEFSNKNKMTFEFNHFMNEIIFSDIKKYQEKVKEW